MSYLVSFCHSNFIFSAVVSLFSIAFLRVAGPFQEIFQLQYDTCHRLETNKLRNVAKFFAHLLHSDAVSWEVRTHTWLHTA